MRDTTLYQHLLGLKSPWTVSQVELNIENQRVDVWVKHAKGLQWACPECGTEGPLYDHEEERVWWHLDSCQFQTLLSCTTTPSRMPWAEPRARFILLFEHFAIDVLRQTNIKATCQILRISWDEAWYILHRAVGHGLSRKEKRVIPRYGVDKKSAGRWQNYITIIRDLDGGTVEEVTEDNNKQSLPNYFDHLTPEQIDGIEAVSMDMSKA